MKKTGSNNNVTKYAMCQVPSILWPYTNEILRMAFNVADHMTIL